MQKVWEPFTVLDLIISWSNMSQEEEEYEIKVFCGTVGTRGLAAVIFFPWDIIPLASGQFVTAQFWEGEA